MVPLLVFDKHVADKTEIKFLKLRCETVQLESLPRKEKSVFIRTG